MRVHLSRHRTLALVASLRSLVIAASTGAVPRRVATLGSDGTDDPGRFRGDADEVDDKLRSIMQRIHKTCAHYGGDGDGHEVIWISKEKPRPLVGVFFRLRFFK